MLEVSCRPVSRLSLSLPYIGIIRHDVSLVVLGEALYGGLYDLHPTRLPHVLSGEVAVSPGPVPVSLHRLRVEGDDDPEVLGDPAEKVAGDPEVVSHVDALAGPDLVLPLGRHDLGVGAGDPDAGIETGAVVSLHNVPAVHLVSPHTAVVGTLGTRSWANQRGAGPGQAGCTPARYQTRGAAR